MSVIAAPVLVFVYWLVVFTVVDEGDGDGCDDDVGNHNAMKRMTKSKVGRRLYRPASLKLPSPEVARAITTSHYHDPKYHICSVVPATVTEDDSDSSDFSTSPA